MPTRSPASTGRAWQRFLRLGPRHPACEVRHGEESVRQHGQLRERVGDVREQHRAEGLPHRHDGQPLEQAAVVRSPAPRSFSLTPLCDASCAMLLEAKLIEPPPYSQGVERGGAEAGADHPLERGPPAARADGPGAAAGPDAGGRDQRRRGGAVKNVRRRGRGREQQRGRCAPGGISAVASAVGAAPPRHRSAARGSCGWRLGAGRESILIIVPVAPWDSCSLLPPAAGGLPLCTAATTAPSSSAALLFGAQRYSCRP